MLLTTTLLTVSVVVPVTFELEEEEDELVDAVIVVVPIATAVARPEELMVAKVGFDEAHVTDDVMSFVDPSPSVAVAVNCCVLLGCTVGFTGVTASDTTEVPDTKKSPHPVSAASSATVASIATAFCLVRTISSSFRA